MAANTGAFTPLPCGVNQIVTATQFNKLDANGKQSVNRNSTASGTRRFPICPVETVIAAGGGTRLGTPTFGKFTCANTGLGDLFIPLHELPHGHTLNTVGLTVDPAGAHGAQPAVLPSINVYKVDQVGSATSLGTAATVWSDIATYEAGFIITTGALAHTIDRNLYTYWLRVIMESGANSVTGCDLLAIHVACTIDHAEGGTDLSLWV